ncbi:amine oxidase family protein [Acanthamoeba castellanii str. Neff]|uniref:Amine oxidase family protein n=1 Tax=Acanthamoeba castellanii (strain ATCC 30010 / Neff) TaxID=1257118 RepID=L8GWP7_ACACF|nr:amine oxidase family protein [Acanthamoeba castellanii str. Neff]ELR17430.1 amine oxidase family protein [Acanthamoeba castellanii str. Neff]
MDGKRDVEDGGAKPAAKSLEDELGLDSLTERVGTQQRLLGRLRQLFAEGQYRDMDLEPPPEDAWYNTWLYREFVWKRPRWLAVLLPIVVVWVSWTTAMTALDEFHLFEDKYFMTITMLFASMVAGATSEGASAVAFPVMTLFFKIKPSVARDMSLMTQSVGMNCAAFTILYQKIRIEPNALLFSSCGGAFGVVVGLQWVAPNLPPSESKLIFVSIWLGFAAALFCLNLIKDREVHLVIQNFNNWRAGVLMFFGFIGGVLTAIFGSGLDICTFSVLTLLFRVSEKTATPTTVVLQAWNCTVGMLAKFILMDGMEQEAVDYFWVSASIVSIGAPIGSFLSSFVHRIILGIFLYVADVVQFVAALIIIPLNKPLVILVLGILTLSFGVFFGMTKMGDVLMRYEKKHYGRDQASNMDDSGEYQSEEEKTKILKVQPLYSQSG